jgi:hypothetical protein
LPIGKVLIKLRSQKAFKALHQRAPFA